MRSTGQAHSLVEQFPNMVAALQAGGPEGSITQRRGSVQLRGSVLEGRHHFIFPRNFSQSGGVLLQTRRE